MSILSTASAAGSASAVAVLPRVMRRMALGLKTDEIGRMLTVSKAEQL